VEEPPPDLDALAGGLARTMGRLRRSLNRQVRAGSGADALAEAQLEIVRLLHRRPGLRVHDVAVELGLASNTVSTLIHQLADAGLLERSADPADARVTHLHLSPAAEQLLQRRRDLRSDLLATRLVELDGHERQTLARALLLLESIALSLEAASTAAVAAPAAARADGPFTLPAEAARAG